MSWWWVEGRLKKKFRTKANPRGWMPLYCAREERGAKLIIRQIEAVRNATNDKFDKARQAENEALRKYKEFRVAPPKEEKSSKRSKAQKVSEEVAIVLRPDCPGCGAHGARRVTESGKRLWKCRACARSWPRDRANSPQEPPKGKKGRSGAPKGPGSPVSFLTEIDRELSEALGVSVKKLYKKKG